MKTAPALGEGGRERAAGVDVDDRRSARRLPGGEADRLRLVGVGAGDEQHVGVLVVLEGRAEGVDAGVGEPGDVIAVCGGVVGSVVRRTDRFEGELGQGVDVLVELVGVALHSPGQLAVVFDNVLGDLSDDVGGGVPGDRLEGAADPQ